MEGAERCLLDHYARHLWSWCLERRITLRAEHIPGCLNTIADRESRATLDTSDWHLNQNFFQTLMDRLGQCTIDLFASRTNHQLSRFFSYKPDPEAEAIDALTQPWEIVIHEKATITLVCLVRPTRPWYVQLLQLVVDTPILLPITTGLLTGPQGQEHPLVNKRSSYFPAGGYQTRSSYKRLIRTSYGHCPRCPENFNPESVQVMLVKMGGLVS